MLDAMQTQQHQLAQDFEAGSAELSLLEAHVLESACDDPGALLLPHLILPYLQKRLEAEAAQFHAQTDAGSASYGTVSVARPPDPFRLPHSTSASQLCALATTCFRTSIILIITE